MFSKLIKREKPRVYLGRLAVVSKQEFKNSDGWNFFKSENVNEDLKESLCSAIQLPQIDSRKDTKANDLALEFVVISDQGGDFSVFHSTDFFIPIFWRPKVEVKARLYKLNNGKTVHYASSKKKIAWREFFLRSLSLKSIFGFAPLFNAKDMEMLLCLAALDVLKRLTKKL